MSDDTQVSCEINTTDSSKKLGIEIRLDNNIIYNSDHVQDLIKFTYDLNNDDGEHLLEFIMKNKTSDHTKIDADGNIIEDARLTISNLAFEEIALNQIFIDHAIYTHDFNGTQPTIKDKFFGDMGCNGTVSLRFTTPIYLWLLEHM